MTLRADDFNLLAQILKQRSGLIITPDKTYLLESRLLPIGRTYNATTLEELCGKIRASRDEKLLSAITEAMTTNESSFFRDQKPFDQFKATVLPYLTKARANKRHLRIWSAASSSGQEAYSLAMLLMDNQALWRDFKIEIVGTDLSAEMVERARTGVYSQFEVQRGLPITMLVKYFEQSGPDRWQIKPEIRGMVQYKEANLLNDLSTLGTFDVVFCRNVLIYFDQPTKGKVLEAIARQMPPDGILYLGGAETVLGISDRFKPLPDQRGLYVLKENMNNLTAA